MSSWPPCICHADTATWRRLSATNPDSPRYPAAWSSTTCCRSSLAPPSSPEFRRQVSSTLSSPQPLNRAYPTVSEMPRVFPAVDARKDNRIYRIHSHYDQRITLKVRDGHKHPAPRLLRTVFHKWVFDLSCSISLGSLFGLGLVVMFWYSWLCIFSMYFRMGSSDSDDIKPLDQNSYSNIPQEMVWNLRPFSTKAPARFASI